MTTDNTPEIEIRTISLVEAVRRQKERARPKVYVLVCRGCDDLELPFPSAQERGRWAAEPRAATGHHDWRVFDA